MRRFLPLIVTIVVGIGGLALADSPALPVTSNAAGYSVAKTAGTFLKLDTSNDPLTGDLTIANGTAAAPGINSAIAKTAGWYTPTAGEWWWSSGGAAELSMTSTAVSPAVTSGLALGTSPLQWERLYLAGGTAAAPSFTFGGSNVTGLYGGPSGVNFTVAGVAKAWMNATAFEPVTDGGSQLGSSLTQWKSLNTQAGGVASPAIQMGDTNSGFYGATGLDSVNIATGGTLAVAYDNTNEVINRNVLPNTTTTFNLGSATQMWNGAYLSSINGNNTTITIQPGATATSAQGVSILGYNDDSADATTLKVFSTRGGGTAAAGTIAQSIVENNTTHTDVEKTDATGTGLWSVRTGAVQIGAFSSSSKGITPAAIFACTATNSGFLWYKEDTDTAATAPALCFCSRDNATLTYSWKLISGTGTCT